MLAGRVHARAVEDLLSADRSALRLHKSVFYNTGSHPRLKKKSLIVPLPAHIPPPNQLDELTAAAGLLKVETVGPVYMVRE